MSFLEIENLTVKYDEVIAIKEVSLSIGKGELISIVGPNGSGKSTLIKAILGLIKYTGTISLGGHSINDFRQRISYMPQSEDIDMNFPITVQEVVMQSQFRKTNPDKKEFEKAMVVNDLLKLKDKSLNELSGGLFQRVFLARTLAQNGDLVLLDEPFSNMDVNNQKNVIEILQELKKQGKTILLTTHNLKLAHDISSKVLFLNTKVICFSDVKDAFSAENLIDTFGEEVIVEGGLKVSDQHKHR